MVGPIGRTGASHHTESGSVNYVVFRTCSFVMPAWQLALASLWPPPRLEKA